MEFNTIVQLISASAAIGALFLISYQLYQQTKQSKFEVLTAIHREVGTKEFRKALKIIFKAKQEELLNPYSKEVLESIELVTGLYDLVGIRLEEGVLPKAATLKSEWKILVLLWRQVQGFVLREREDRGLPYKEHFQMISLEAEKYWKKYYPESDPKVVTKDDIVKQNSSVPKDYLEPQLLYRGKHLHFYGGDNCWEYVHRSNATEGVTIVAVTQENKIILVEQYRVPVRKFVIELPAGLINDPRTKNNEDPVAAVKRELEEETGYSCDKITCLSKGTALPGLSDEINILYLVEVLNKIRHNPNGTTGEDDIISYNNKGLAEEGEEITVYEIPLKKVVKWLSQQSKKGKIVDLKVYSGLFFLTSEKQVNLF